MLEGTSIQIMVSLKSVGSWVASNYANLVDCVRQNVRSYNARANGIDTNAVVMHGRWRNASCPSDYAMLGRTIRRRDGRSVEAGGAAQYQLYVLYPTQ